MSWPTRKVLALLLAVFVAAGLSLSAVQASDMTVKMGMMSGMDMSGGGDCGGCPDKAPDGNGVAALSVVPRAGRGLDAAASLHGDRDLSYASGTAALSVPFGAAFATRSIPSQIHRPRLTRSRPPGRPFAAPAGTGTFSCAALPPSGIHASSTAILRYAERLIWSHEFQLFHLPQERPARGGLPCRIGVDVAWSSVRVGRQ